MTPDRTETSRVVVLYGALRSGTTLFRLILDHHPQISCPGERDFMIDHIEGGRVDTEALGRSRIFRASGLGLPPEGDGAAAFRALLAEERARSAPVLVLVIHRHLGRLLDVMPDCRFIHLVRDPRDVARSSIGMGWAGNTHYGIRHWLKTEGTWARERHRIAEDRVHTLRYEDLVAAPEAELGRVCAFLGLDYDPAMMGYVETSTYSDLDPRLSFQWRHKQSPEEIAHVEHQAGALMAELGYAPSGHDRAPPSAPARARLWLDDKIAVWRFRVRRYGLADPLILALSRRLGLKGPARRARARIDEIAARHLK